MLVTKSTIMEIEPYKPGLSKILGQDKITKLSSNENSYGPSPKAIEAYSRCANNLFRYPDGGANLIREAIASIKNIDANRIVCGAGSDELIAFLCAAYASDGDEILLSEYGFLMYPISALRVGATPIKAKEVNLTANIHNLLEKVNNKTRILFLANPNNPTGTYISYEEIMLLHKELPRNVLLVIDEAYAEYAYADDYRSALKLVDEVDNIVVLRTFSKIYGLAALRLGWCYSSGEVADVLNRVRGPFNISIPAIEAGIAAFNDFGYIKDCKQANLLEYLRIKEELGLIGIKIIPSQANFYLCDFTESKKTAKQVNDYLLTNGIIVRDVSSYNLPQYLRITIGKPEENSKVIEILRKLFM